MKRIVDTLFSPARPLSHFRYLSLLTIDSTSLPGDKKRVAPQRGSRHHDQNAGGHRSGLSSKVQRTSEAHLAANLFAEKIVKGTHMSSTAAEPKGAPGMAPGKQAETKDAWRGFKPGLWQRDVNVRWFLQQNYTPYDGDGAFLAPATERTRSIWKKLEAMFVEERKKKGVLDVSQVPSSITAHAPGYIDRANEVIVGLQTEAPLKRAIMPNGGLRMVLSSLKAYGYEPNPAVVE